MASYASVPSFAYAYAYVRGRHGGLTSRGAICPYRGNKPQER
jgi:hypothetical protein